MIVFNNRDRPNYERVVDMGPRWLNEYREMNANYRFAGWTLDLMAQFLEQLVLNEFPRYCDINTLRTYEKIFAIEYDGDVTIEERRRTVLAYWGGIGKINKTAIIGIVSQYTGTIADVRWDNEALIIDFDNTDTKPVSIGMLQKLLRRRMPAHIDYRLRCVCSAGIRIEVRAEKWRTIFEQAGTRPGVSTGLRISEPRLELNTSETGGHRGLFGMTGEEVTGEKPKPSTRLSLNPVDIEADTTGTGGSKAAHPMAGNADAGTIPKTSTALNQHDNYLESEVTAESWQAEYQMCGETFDL